jgi:hypothetical protein
MRAISLNGNSHDITLKGNATASKLANELTESDDPIPNLSLKVDGVVLRPNAQVPENSNTIEVVDISGYEWPES